MTLSLVLFVHAEPVPCITVGRHCAWACLNNCRPASQLSIGKWLGEVNIERIPKSTINLLMTSSFLGKRWSQFLIPVSCVSPSFIDITKILQLET